MSGTPLTDAINALTTYSNTVTGASDTTLSEAVATLASGYGGGGYVEPLHPAMTYFNGDTSLGTLEVYRKDDCTHFRAYFKKNYTLTNDLYLNVNELIAGTTPNTYINNRNLWFTIPSNKQAVLTVKNVTNAGNMQWRWNFRKANNQVSIDSGLGSSNGTHLSGETLTATFASAQSVGCFWVVIPNAEFTQASGKTLEFDVSLTVDGDLYF